MDWSGIYCISLFQRIDPGSEGKECYIPVNSDLIGGIRGLKIEVGLIGRHVLGVFYAIGNPILLGRVGSSGKETGDGAVWVGVREPVVGVRGRTGAKAGDITIACRVLPEDIIEAPLGIDAVLFVSGESVGIEALDPTPAASLGVASPEEIVLAVAVGAAMDGDGLGVLQILFQVRQQLRFSHDREMSTFVRMHHPLYIRQFRHITPGSGLIDEGRVRIFIIFRFFGEQI